MKAEEGREERKEGGSLVHTFNLDQYCVHLCLLNLGPVTCVHLMCVFVTDVCCFPFPPSPHQFKSYHLQKLL